MHGIAVLLARENPPHRNLVTFFYHVEGIDPGARHMLRKRPQHVSRTSMTRPKAAERGIVQLEVFREPFGDMINVSGGHRFRDP
jgi:hypothetical protein